VPGEEKWEVAHLLDTPIWVQSDEREAERRVLAGIGEPGEAPTVWHHREWMAEEGPFNIAQRTWERADVIVCGTPQIPSDPVTEIVLAPPLTPVWLTRNKNPSTPAVREARDPTSPPRH
jgi:hypothetical protein